MNSDPQDVPSGGAIPCSSEPDRPNCRGVGERPVLIDVVEEDPGDAEWLARALGDAGYRVRVFPAATDYRNLDSAERAALAIVGMTFSGGRTALLADLGLGGREGIPVIALSAHGDLASRLSALQAGANRFIVKPADTSRLIGLVEQLVDRRAREPYRALLVDDDPVALAMQAEVLRASGLEVMALSEPLQFLDAVDRFVPDVAVLDISMPDAEGPELAAVLRERDPDHAIPILYLSVESDLGRTPEELRFGGDDFLVKPVKACHLVTAVTVRAERGRRTVETRKALDSVLYERQREHLALDRHAIVSVADRAGVIIHVNDKFCEVSGYSRSELLGQNHRIVKSGLHSDEFYRGLWRTIAHGEIWKGEICNRRKDGELYWVESTVVPFLDAAGRPYQYVSIRTDITHVKHAAERLRISQNHANIGTWDWDLQTGVVFWSQPIGPMFGYPEGVIETTSERFLDAVHPDDRQRVVDAATACIERGEKYDVEHRCVWPDGTVRWLAECGDMLRDADGTPRNMLGVVQDVTDRKQAEAALERERGLLQEAQRIARIGNWEIVGTTSELLWSDTVFEIFGREPDSFTPTSEGLHQAVHPEDRDLVRAAIAGSRRTGRYDMVHRIVRPDGEIRYINERARVEHDSTGSELLRRGVVQDITELKRTEAALHASNARQHAQLNAAHCLRDITKSTLDDDLSDADMLVACIARLQVGGLTPSDNRVRIRHGGRLIAMEDFRETLSQLAAPIPFFEEAGSEIEVFCIAGDPTARAGAFTWNDAELLKDIARQIGQSLIRRADRRALVLAKEEAEAANRAKSEFLSSMSHELRTPLNAILGFAQVLEIDEELNEDQIDSVQTIRKSGKHLLQLINEVLDLALIESGRLDLSIERVDLADVLTGCESLLAPIAADRQIVTEVSLVQGAHAVQADHTRLKQVLVNLMSNAVKYNHQGGRITVTAATAGADRIRISVSDTGDGIPQDKLCELFTPFNRLGAERTDIEGTGIGLVICKRLTEAMDGQIGVDSATGAGSTFWIELPAAEPAPVTAHPAPRIRSASRFTTAKVLYIEDNAANLKLVRFALARHPQITLIEAQDGALGLELARAHRPELILLDINMPGMNGLEVMARLNADPATHAIPVIAISAAAMERDVQKAKAAGFRDYLIKPIDIPEFLAAVERLLLLPDRRRPGDRRAHHEPPCGPFGAVLAEGGRG